MKTLSALIALVLVDTACTPLQAVSDARDTFQHSARVKAEETLCDDLSMKEYRAGFNSADRQAGYAKLCSTRLVTH